MREAQEKSRKMIARRFTDGIESRIDSSPRHMDHAKKEFLKRQKLARRREKADKTRAENAALRSRLQSIESKEKPHISNEIIETGEMMKLARKEQKVSVQQHAPGALSADRYITPWNIHISTAPQQSRDLQIIPLRIRTVST